MHSLSGAVVALCVLSLCLILAFVSVPVVSEGHTASLKFLVEADSGPFVRFQPTKTGVKVGVSVGCSDLRVRLRRGHLFQSVLCLD